MPSFEEPPRVFWAICRGEEVASGKLPRRRLARSEVLTQARARCVQLREGHFSCAAVVNLTQDGPKRRRVEAGKSWCYWAGVSRGNAHQAEGVEMVETCSDSLVAHMTCVSWRFGGSRWLRCGICRTHMFPLVKAASWVLKLPLPL